MTTTSVVLQLVVVLTTVAMTTVSGGRTFRLAAIRKQASPPPYFRIVLDRVDQLATQVSELQADVEDMHETIKIINATVNPPVVTPCDIEIQSVGYWESECSYIKVNGNYAWELMSPEDENDIENPSGTYTVLLDKNTCTLKEHKFFDTHFSRNEANRLARYLYFLPYETHVIVLTLGEAFSNMTDSAYEEFDNLGVEIGDMVQVGHTLVSLIVVGSHCNTMYELYEEEPAYLYFQLNGDTEKNSYFTHKSCDMVPCECEAPEWKKRK